MASILNTVDRSESNPRPLAYQDAIGMRHTWANKVSFVHNTYIHIIDSLIHLFTFIYLFFKD